VHLATDLHACIASAALECPEVTHCGTCVLRWCAKSLWEELEGVIFAVLRQGAYEKMLRVHVRSDVGHRRRSWAPSGPVHLAFRTVRIIEAKFPSLREMLYSALVVLGPKSLVHLE
jgi:hypothetical protein